MTRLLLASAAAVALTATAAQPASFIDLDELSSSGQTTATGELNSQDTRDPQFNPSEELAFIFDPNNARQVTASIAATGDEDDLADVLFAFVPFDDTQSRSLTNPDFAGADTPFDTITPNDTAINGTASAEGILELLSTTDPFALVVATDADGDGEADIAPGGNTLGDSVGITVTITTAAVPVPPAALLLVSAMAGLGYVTRRKLA